jgi:hypothetical protein
LTINLPEDPLSLRDFIPYYSGASGSNQGMLRSLSLLIEKLSSNSSPQEAYNGATEEIKEDGKSLID